MSLPLLAWAALAFLAMTTLPLPMPGPAAPVQAAHQDLVVIGVPCAGTSPPEFPIAIRDFEFDPETAIVERGTIVNWTNLGPNEPHTTTSPGVWDSGALDVGEFFRAKMCQRGFFEYLCTIHGFTGQLFVR